MDARTLDVFHHTRNEEVLAVADGVHLALGAHQVFVHQHRVRHIHMAGDDGHVFPHIVLIVGDDHILSAQHVGRTQQHRVAQLCAGGQCLLTGEHRVALRARNAALFQQRVETLPVLRLVDGVRTGAQNLHTQLCQVFCQLDGRLAAELHHTGPWLFRGDDMLHAFFRERVEIQTVAGIEVRGDGLGVVVDDDSLAAVAFQHPCAVHAAIVELDALPDADGAAAEHQHLFPVGGVFRDKLRRFVLLVKSGIEIRRFRTELGRAGVHHLIGRAQLFTGQRIQSRQTQHGLVQEALHFCGAVQLFRQYAASQPGQRKLCFGQPLQLCQKPRVNFSDIVNRLKRHAALDGLVHNKRAVGIAHMQFFHHFFVRQRRQRFQRGRFQPQLDALHRFHEGVFEAVGNGHHLARGHHLRAQGFLGVYEFVERPFRELDHTVIQRGLEAGAGLPCDVVGDLVQRIADSDLRGHLGDGIARSLAGQRRGTGHAGIHLDDGVFEAVWL